ncbi:MAG: LicD family protein [Blautia sp.]|nr:LicD family protein [Blautia sp.]MDD7729278.1 LicD family protein [Clostridia bacterium]MDY5664352.1 LicD family protein [Blautia sp.]
MTEKQEHLLQLFQELDEICKENNLRYVMAGGTAIGVVRNEGFIPWDDDVDVYMPRDDWNKLVELSRTALPEHRALQCVDVDRSYTNTFPRYASTDSCALHKHQIIGDDTAGEIIDVLTLDPIPADDKEYEKYRTHMMIYSELVNIAVVFGARWEIPVSKYLRYLFSYTFLGKDRTLKKLEKIMFSYKEEDCPRYAMRWGGCPFLFDKDMMFPVKYMNFEGIKVMVPHRMSDYLIWHYGDEWSYIPPHGERESHDAITVEGISYQELREDYLPGIKKGKLRRDSVWRKIYYLATAKRTHRLSHKRDLLRAKSTVMDLYARIRECGHGVKELVQERDFKTLNHIFEKYFQVQLSAGFIGREDFSNIYPFYHPTLLEIDDDTFTAAMLTLVYTERVGKAFRMLQVRENLDHLNPEMKKLQEDILLFRKGVSHYEFKEMEEAEKIADELLERYPEVPGFMKFKSRFLMERARKDGYPGEAELFIEEALRIFPEDGYFLKYRGEILWIKGRCADALAVFADAREKTNNGITQLELDKFLKPYSKQTVDTCYMLLNNREKQGALELMKLWHRLLPEDEQVTEAFYVARVSAARTRHEMEETIGEIMERLDLARESPDKRGDVTENVDIYKKALTKAWERLGYPGELAKLRTEILYTQEPGELEWLSEKVKDCQIHKDKRAEVYKVLGDARKKQGQTGQAFENYRKSVEYASDHAYVKTELSRIFFNDLYEGDKKARTYAAKTDAAEYLNQWLDKYESPEALRKLTEKLL